MKKWFSDLHSPGTKMQFISLAEYWEPGTPTPDIKVEELLNINADNLKPFTSDLLHVLNSNDSENELLRSLVYEVLKGYRAYIQFIDILDPTMFPWMSERELHHRHYCYFESLCYLNEALLSWFDGNTLATLTLLRPFLEMSVLDIYWTLKSRKDEYRGYYSWLDSGSNQPLTRSLKEAFSILGSVKGYPQSRVRLVESTLLGVYKGLCSYVHVPRTEGSLGIQGRSLGVNTYQAHIYAMQSLNILLKQVVYSWILVYPMSLFPVDVIRKFAFNGPMGYFFDHVSYEILRDYIGSNNADSLIDELKDTDEVVRFQDFFNSHADLSMEEIESSWRNSAKASRLDVKDLPFEYRNAVCSDKAKTRSMSWWLNYDLPDYVGPAKPCEEKLITDALSIIMNWKAPPKGH